MALAAAVLPDARVRACAVGALSSANPLPLWSRGHGHDRDIRYRRAVAGGGLAVARTLTKKGGASTASCQCGFEGGTRRHADLLDMCVISPPVRGTRSARRCRLRTPLGQELK
jgi:hypothetical protein